MINSIVYEHCCRYTRTRMCHCIFFYVFILWRKYACKNIRLKERKKIYHYSYGFFPILATRASLQQLFIGCLCWFSPRPCCLCRVVAKGNSRGWIRDMDSLLRSLTCDKLEACDCNIPDISILVMCFARSRVGWPRWCSHITGAIAAH